MNERPILFSGAMVRAILDGRKTVTRRVVKPRDLAWMDEHQGLREPCNSVRCPYGQPGDRLWVRETWCSPEKEIAGFAADGRCGAWIGDSAGGRVWVTHGFILEAPGYSDCFREPARTWGIGAYGGKWRPSIHMPRWASRILLEISAVRVERLQDISEEQSRAEGITDGGCTNCGNHEPCGCACPAPNAVDSFSYLWESINGVGSWNANPWVWVVEFKRVTP